MYARGVQFIDDLRAYLERPVSPEPVFVPDLAAHRRHLLESLDRLPDAEAGRLHRQISRSLALIVRALAALIEDELGAMPGKDIATLIDVAVDRHIGLGGTSGSRSLDLELDRLSTAAFVHGTAKAILQDQTERRAVRPYALNTGLVRPAKGGWVATPSARLVLELPLRDTIRWLLALESTQSHSAGDDWRLSRAAAAALIETPAWEYQMGDDMPPSPVSWTTLARLSKLGIVNLHDTRRGVIQCTVLPEGRPFLEEVAGTNDTPFMLLARALLQDETGAVLSQYPAAAAMVRKESAASLVTRHARMIAHEMRNVVVPMQIGLDAFYDAVGASGADALTGRHRGVLDAGVDRILGFVQEIADMADLATTPAELFTLVPAIEDAVQLVETDLPRRLSFAKEAELPPVMGYRQRFVMAVCDLLRNAAQARADPPVEIRITAGLHNGAAVFVRVDDDGPGVPPEDREKVFVLGFSRRPGGTGRGLAFVREVVEEEMLGKVVCEASPLGGARFVIRLPVGTRRSP